MLLGNCFSFFSEAASTLESPLGRSVRPAEPLKSVSPQNSSDSSGKYIHTPPGVWPGVNIHCTVGPGLEKL